MECIGDYGVLWNSSKLIGLKLQSYLQSSLAPRNNNEIALKNFLPLTDS